MSYSKDKISISTTMEAQAEKIYVALGNDLQDGFKTLEWALRKWNPILNSISLRILYVSYSINISKDLVNTPFGKLPASSISEEMLESLERYEQQKSNQLLSKYIDFCGKVKVDVHRIEKTDDPMPKLIVDLISEYQITKLVMGITFMKSPSWKSKNAISASFYVHQHKPDFCEFFVICGGKLVTIDVEKDENDDNMIGKSKEKGNIKNWLGKMFNENSSRKSSCSSKLDLINEFDKDSQEIEIYFRLLMSFNLDEEVVDCKRYDHENLTNLEDMSFAEKNKYLKTMIQEANKKIELQKKESKANAERYSKAEWAISLCNKRVGEFEARLKEEVENKNDIEKQLKGEKEELYTLKKDVKESKEKLSSLSEIQSDLSNKISNSTSRKSEDEIKLQALVTKRMEMEREIEKLKRQRDVLNRRIEYYKEKDAIGIVSKLRSNKLRCGYREYDAEDVRLATDDFSERLRMKSGGDWTSVYRGRIGHTTVAIKMLNGLSSEEFRAKVELLSSIRHPNLIAMLGFCTELKCIIFEYMHCGNLRDNLFTSQRNSRKGRILKWNDRIRIAHQVCSGIGFLHSANPKPVVHGHLTPSNILLDRNFVAKISGFGRIQNHEQSDLKPDIRAFGVLLLHLLTGRNWPGLLKAMTMDWTALVGVLDEMVGKWPLDLAKDVSALAMKCLSSNPDIKTVMKELGELSKKANETSSEEHSRYTKGDSSDVPSVFLCPIFQEVMRDPHVAADGFSYELEAIEEWVRMGHDASPMTNLRLKHTSFTPNHTLRSFIQDWLSRRPNLSADN